MKRRKKDRKPARRVTTGQRARSEGRVLKSYQVGGLPIINSILERMNLEALLMRYLPVDDPRIEVPTSTTLVLLIRNLLLSREPLYGIGEWASRFAPCTLGFSEAQLAQLNDDRMGRSLDRLFAAGSDFILAVVRQVIQEFQLDLDELHNDATTVSFFGAYYEARQEGRRGGQRTLAITWGHSKDRPDLKQLLYLLHLTDKQGELRDSYRVCGEKLLSAEGFRIHWYHSQRQQESDAQWRSTNLQRAMNELCALRNKTQSPRTRYRDRQKVQQAVDKILDARSVTSLLRVTIEEVQQETYFFVLLVQTLLERELRLAMARTKTVCLPLYPEGRACKKPTTRRVLDVFEPIQRHQFQEASGCHQFRTDLQPIHRQVLGLLNIREKTYGD